MKTSPSGEELAFAGFSLEPARRRLRGPDGAEIPVRPRIFDLLMLFLTRPGELIGKQEIMRAIWPDTTVDENNLNQAISTLRRALGDSPSRPRLIATVPRRGYQFIAPVRPAGQRDAPAGAAPLIGRVQDAIARRIPYGRWRAASIAGTAATAAAFAVIAPLRLTAGEPVNEQAHEHYLLGRAYLAQSGVPMLHAAVEELEAATRLDPGYGPAWVSLAIAADTLEIEEPRRAEIYRKLQREAVARAGATAPGQWDAIAVRARLLMRERDWAGATEALEDARAATPPGREQQAAIEGVFLMHTGRPSEAVPLFGAGSEADPLSFSMAAWHAWALDLTGDRAAALAEYEHARTLPGDDTAWAFQQLVRLLEAGDSRAIDAYLANYPYSEDATGAMMRYLSASWRSPSDVLAILWMTLDPGTINGPHRLDGLSLLAAHYGDNELALRLLREEFFGRGGGATAHLWNPALAGLRRTDGFRTLVADLGFVDYWRETGAWPDFCRPEGADDFACK